MKLSKIENKIISFFEKHYIILAFIVITILAFYLRYKMFPFISDDYESFLEQWFNFFKNNGFRGLANYPGDYNAPYMTILAMLSYFSFDSLLLIKIVSVAFDYILAISCVYLSRQIFKEKNSFRDLMIYMIILFLPQVFFNSSMWGQCDSIYSSFVVLALAFLIKEKYRISFILLGVAFSFKLQFIFILPLYIILYINKKKFSIFDFLIIPIVDLVMCLPALIMGKSIKDCLLVYLLQTGTYADKLVMNFANIYQLIPNNVEIFYSVGKVFILFICAFMLIYVIYKNVNFNKEKIITLGLWFLVIFTFFLPGMHERYLYVGEILSIVYLICYRKNIFLILMMNLNAFITYSIYLNGLNFEYLNILTIVYLVSIIYFTKSVFELLDCEECIYEKK